jgi:hypothetical protein
VNLTKVKFTQKHLNTLNLGFQYAMEKHSKFFLNNLIIEPENAIKHLALPLQTAYRHLAFKKLKQIQHTTQHNALHKRHKYNLQQIKHTLVTNNLSLVKADKGKTIVIIHNNILQQKIRQYMTDNNIVLLHRDPTDLFQKHLQKTITQCPTLIHKSLQKHIMQMKPNAPYLNILIKIHKQDAPIRPIVNNRPDHAHKLAKFLTNQLAQLLQLPYTYALKHIRSSIRPIQSLH